MSLSTFSRIPLAMHCLGSAVLPGTGAETSAGDRGTSRHAVAAAAVTVGREKALAQAKEEHRAEASLMDLDAIVGFFGPGAEIVAEAAFAYDPDTETARHLGNNIGRAYRQHGANMDEEFCGALDLHSHAGGLILLLDLKGKSKADPWQLKAQAVAVRAHYGADQVNAAYGYVQEDGSIRFERFEWTALDLDGFAEELRELKKRIKHAEDGRPSLTEGLHCTYCPAFKGCPAKTALVRAIPGELAALEQKVAALTQEEKGRAWAWLDNAEMVLKKIRATLEEHATQEPFRATDGRLVRPVESNRRYLDGEIAWDVLVKQYGEDAVRAAFERSTSQAAIKRALNGGGKEALALLERHGAFTSKTTVSVKAVDE